MNVLTARNFGRRDMEAWVHHMGPSSRFTDTCILLLSGRDPMHVHVTVVDENTKHSLLDLLRLKE
jgi:hypothetical protein